MSYLNIFHYVILVGQHNRWRQKRFVTCTNTLKVFKFLIFIRNIEILLNGKSVTVLMICHKLESATSVNDRLIATNFWFANFVNVQDLSLFPNSEMDFSKLIFNFDRSSPCQFHPSSFFYFTTSLEFLLFSANKNSYKRNWEIEFLINYILW